MRTLASAAIPLPIVFASDTFVDRLCLHSTSVVRIRMLAAAYRAYHALVLEFQYLIEKARLEDDISL